MEVARVISQTLGFCPTNAAQERCRVAGASERSLTGNYYFLGSRVLTDVLLALQIDAETIRSHQRYQYKRTIQNNEGFDWLKLWTSEEQEVDVFDFGIKSGSRPFPYLKS